MRVAIGFEKRREVRFVSHLDLQRALQRALRRAGLPLEYSQGFNPHPRISLASALAVGTESREEWLEVHLTRDMTAPAIEEALAPALPPGLSLTRVAILPEGGKALMALVGRVTYALEGENPWRQEQVDAFLAQDEIFVEKRSKKGMRRVDIRPMILDMRLEGSGRLILELTHGEGWSIKPELVMEAFDGFTGRQPEPLRICRLGMYAGREGPPRPLIEEALGLSCPETP